MFKIIDFNKEPEKIYHSIPNPVPTIKPFPCPPPPPCNPPHHHHHKPLYWEEDKKYVTKCELNRVLANLAEADIFTDLSVNGTTATVGGIKKGTIFNKLTFAQFMEKALYPTEEPTYDFDYPCETQTGKTVLNSNVLNDIGGFKKGDSLKGMTISQILEKLLCGTNIWGTYSWKSDIYDLDANITSIDATAFCPKYIEELEKAESNSEAEYTSLLQSGIYEIYVVCKKIDKEDETKYKNNILIASSDFSLGPNSQTTVPFLPYITSETKWIYNKETKKIELLNSSNNEDLCIIMIKR